MDFVEYIYYYLTNGFIKRISDKLQNLRMNCGNLRNAFIFKIKNIRHKHI